MAKLQFKMFKEDSLRVMWGNAGKSQATGARVVNTVKDAGENQPKVIICYNFKGADCDDQATTSAIFMASLSSAGSLNDDTVTLTYDSNILSKVPHYDNYHDSKMLLDVQEAEYIEHIISNKDSYNEPTSDSNVISYVDYMAIIENYDAKNVSSYVKR
uniref:Uncharacterized protein n=1 Tax=Tanacetum cinerariifolium TaxID=118510 RepID=A0A699JBB8_TANCI|nr:hypothetical protein [Tanacetum cinerariifolium]